MTELTKPEKLIAMVQGRYIYDGYAKRKVLTEEVMEVRHHSVLGQRILEQRIQEELQRIHNQYGVVSVKTFTDPCTTDRYFIAIFRS